VNSRYPPGAEDVDDMMAFAGVFYLVSTYAFVVFCIAIGIRLVRLSRRTGARPELLLGGALGLMGGLGYGILITMSLSRGWFGEAGLSWIPAVSLFGKGVHDIGVLFMLSFVLTVFRPTETWARALAGVMATALIVGFFGHAITDGFRDVRPQTPYYWLGFATIGTIPVWGAAESFLYHGLMKKRQAIGLADPMVVNRFLLWGIASTFSVLAVWTVSLPSLLNLPVPRQTAMAPFTLSLTAIWGIGAIGSYWLAFFPPSWYAQRVAARTV
jgi:hypothetical protein